jgi:hypothetical protein
LPLPVKPPTKLTPCGKDNTMTPDVIDVKIQPNFELLVTFADGARKLFSMLPYLQYPAFRRLSEPGKFAQAHVSNGTVEWTDEIDISPDTLYISGQPAT